MVLYIYAALVCLLVNTSGLANGAVARLGWPWPDGGSSMFHWSSVKAAVRDNPFLRTLDDAIDAAGLGQALSDGRLVATVFAPTDDAFARLLKHLDMSREELLRDTDLLTAVLKYHVFPDAALRSDDIEDGQKVDSLLRGQSATLRVQDFFVFKRITVVPSDRKAPQAHVIFPNLEGGDAIIHVVDEVLVPCSTKETYSDLAQAVSAHPQLSVLAEALGSAGLTQQLSDESLEATLFAPTDEAFVAVLQRLGMSKEELLARENRRMLIMLLAGHMVPQTLESGSLTAGLELEAASGDVLTIDIRDQAVYVEASRTTARVVAADISSGQAVMHVVDTVLLQ